MKIAFTSCMDAVRVPVQPVWTQIASEEPDVLMLLGDQIYMDWLDLGESNWRREIGESVHANPDALEAFATEMHLRYEAQWNVLSFRKLVCDVGKKGRVLVLWDDHDFAWNNSVGAGPQSQKHWVHPEVKAVSLGLFRQFQKQITDHSDQPYPPLPSHWLEWKQTPEPPDGVGQFYADLAGDDTRWPCLGLDNRWFRTSITAADNVRTMIGESQRESLNRHVNAQGAGLLIVAGGSPLKHKSLESDQGWTDHSNPPLSYPEYTELLGTKRPVLYLGGDIHRNEWGGRLYTTAGQPSQVLQALSSGAALDNVFFKHFASCYGTVKLEGSPQTGSATLTLMKSDKALKTWTPSLLPLKLSFTPDTWVGDHLDGEAAEDGPLIVDDSAPLAVFTVRARIRQYLVEESQGVLLNQTVSVPTLAALDEVYEDDFRYIPEATEPTTVTATPTGGFNILLKSNDDHGATHAADVEALVRETFVRAAAGNKPVVLFIHGQGKNYPDTVMQAYRLRRVYGCEPIVYAWPSGRTGGLLTAVLQIGMPAHAVDRSAVPLREVIKAFGLVAADYPALTKVILARSAGTNVLANCISAGAASDYNQTHLKHVDRIVLSSPLLKVGDFGVLAGLVCPKVVTCNHNDATLSFARKFKVTGPGDILGLDGPSLKQATSTTGNTTYLNFTNSVGVGPLHDYLFPATNDHQVRVNQAMLRDKLFDAAQLTNDLEPATVTGSVHDVK